MSNLSDTSQTELNLASENSRPQADAQSRAKKWSVLQTELNEAVKLWQELETQIKPLSPEERQLQELKELIAQVKTKLSEF